VARHKPSSETFDHALQSDHARIVTAKAFISEDPGAPLAKWPITKLRERRRHGLTGAVGKNGWVVDSLRSLPGRIQCIQDRLVTKLRFASVRHRFDCSGKQ
jgi:hypothetical protein